MAFYWPLCQQLLVHVTSMVSLLYRCKSNVVIYRKLKNAMKTPSYRRVLAHHQILSKYVITGYCCINSPFFSIILNEAVALSYRPSFPFRALSNALSKYISVWTLYRRPCKQISCRYYVSLDAPAKFSSADKTSGRSGMYVSVRRRALSCASSKRSSCKTPNHISRIYDSARSNGPFWHGWKGAQGWCNFAGRLCIYIAWAPRYGPLRDASV